MNWLVVEDCRGLGCSQFEIVVIASQRTYDLEGGAIPMVKHEKADKNTVIALNELSVGKLNLKGLKELAVRRVIISSKASYSGSLIQDPGVLKQNAKFGNSAYDDEIDISQLDRKRPEDHNLSFEEDDIQIDKNES